MDVNQEILTSFLEHKSKLLDANIKLSSDVELCLEGSCACDKIVQMDEIVVLDMDTAKIEIQHLNDEMRDMCLVALNISTIVNDIQWFNKLRVNIEPESKLES